MISTNQMWLMYRETKDERFRGIAESCEKQLDAALYGYDGLHHDVGFMWSLTGVASWKLTGNVQSRKRAMLAASTLASRFNIKSQFIRAWNGDRTGWAIVDCLMNLPILYWASEQAQDPRFANVARAHCDTAGRAQPPRPRAAAFAAQRAGGRGGWAECKRGFMRPPRRRQSQWSLPLAANPPTGRRGRVRPPPCRPSLAAAPPASQGRPGSKAASASG